MSTFTWLIKRESWENRSVWMGPAVTAGVLILIAIAGLFYGIDGSFSAELVSEMGKIGESANLGLSQAALAGLGLIAGAFFVVLQITQYSYLVDCLYSERKDRSILFWKSLPISDSQTVLAKLAFALLVMPAVAAVAMIGTQVVVFLAASMKLSGVPGLLALLWSPSMWGTAVAFALYLYCKVVLWALPLMMWVMLVSAFAPRSPMGLAILIPAVLALIENLLTGTHVIGTAVLTRLSPPSLHGTAHGVDFKADGLEIGTPSDPTWLLHPMDALRSDAAGLLLTPGLWGGLLVAAVFVYAAMTVRRRRDPSA